MGFIDIFALFGESELLRGIGPGMLEYLLGLDGADFPTTLLTIRGLEWSFLRVLPGSGEGDACLEDEEALKPLPRKGETRPPGGEGDLEGAISVSITKADFSFFEGVVQR